MESGDFRRALDEFNRGLRAAPNDADLWFKVAVVYRILGNWDSMMVAYDRARSVDPRNATLYQFIGDSYHWHHRYREAIEAYRKGLSLTPDVVQPRLSLAWSYVLWKGERTRCAPCSKGCRSKPIRVWEAAPSRAVGWPWRSWSDARTPSFRCSARCTRTQAQAVIT